MLCVTKSRPGELTHASEKSKSFLAQEARCEKGIQYSSGYLHLKIKWWRKFVELKMKRRTTEDRLERECKTDSLSLLNKEKINRLKFLEIFKAENHQEPHFAHVLVVVIFIVHETLLLVYYMSGKSKKVLYIDHLWTVLLCI